MGPLIGHVAALGRYPVKSMGGEALEAAELGWSGIKGDRQWAFVAQDRDSRFPWFTGRDHAPLVNYRASYPAEADPKEVVATVAAPDGWTGTIDGPELRERLEAESGRRISLMRLGRGAFDAMPVSLVSVGGHREVEESHGTMIDSRRFRMNLVIETQIPMRVWAGRRLILGGDDGPQLAVTEAIQRCVMITIDPDSGERDPWLMRTVAQQFGNAYGVYANVVRPGPLRRGDAVRLAD
jgi:hypothetical protein